MEGSGLPSIEASLAPDGADAPDAPPAAHPRFAHASEAELARILDFYAVRWHYEPHTFPILWNLDGGVVESFSPDFYLPDFDTYLELTTLRQPLVRKKNRKLRRLRELYPDIRIKLFYARDFRALMLKYGKFGLVDALSGTSGQVTPQTRHMDAADVADTAHSLVTDGEDGETPHAPVDLPVPTDGVADAAAVVPAPILRPDRPRRRAARARTDRQTAARSDG